MTPEQILLRAIQTVPSHAIFVVDSQGRALSWNAGVHEVFGYTEDEWIGKDADRTFVPADRERDEPQRERLLAAEQGTVGDFRWHQRRDGELFWANGVMHAVRDDVGEVSAYVKIARDATRDRDLQDALQMAHDQLAERVDERTRELMLSDALLQRSQERFTEVFRVAPIAIVLTTKEDEIIDVNEAFQRLTGYAREEVLGREATALGLWSSPEDLEKLRGVDGQDRGFRALELQIQTKDGSIRDIISSAAAVDIDHTHGLVKMFLDITDRKSTERHLMAALQEVMQDTSWLANRVMERLARTRGEPVSGAELSELTAREREVLTCIAQGKSNGQIGEELSLAPSTVRNYVANIYSKIGVGSRAEAVVWARDRGMGGL